jgi:SecD/SecF fusion protein
MKNQSLLWRWVVLIGLCALSIWRAYPLSEKLPLGIDLQGGFRFVLGVDYDQMETEDGKPPSEAEKEEAQNKALVVLRNRIDSLGTREASLYKEKNGSIILEVPGRTEVATEAGSDAEDSDTQSKKSKGAEDREKMVELIKQPAYLEFRIVHPDNFRLVQEKFWQTREAPPGYKVVEFNDSLYFQKDPEFEGNYDEALRDRVKLFGRLDNDILHELYLQKERVKGQGSTYEFYRPVYVEKRTLMKGDTISSASTRYNTQEFQYEISLTFKPDSAERFLNITRDYGPGGEFENPDPNLFRHLAIIMDGTLYSAPRLGVAGGIAGGTASISGSFTFEEASTLAAALDSGALPAPIKILTEQQVDPTLGKDSIDQGIKAAIFGLIAVAVFMFVYYLLAGVVVNMALVLDAILMPLGMYIAGGFLGIFADGGGAAGNVNQLPTLTLYGIAGLVLTIGMAVDANVLIFERIREEQKTGKRLVTAISSGFDKAFSTIFDANITTLLVAIILFVQGSGPIRGFAVMLTAGILVSMYTSLVFTRMGFDMIGKTSIEKVKMLSLLPDELNINFLSKDKIAMVLSAVLIIGSVGTIAVKGKDVLGIDFTGGTSIRYELTVPEGESQPSEEEIRDLLTLAGVRESVIQYQRTLIEGNADHQDKTLQVRVDSEFVDAVEQTLVSTYGDSMNLERIGFEDIGAQVGGEMRTQGIKAILYALLGIVIYITIRFEFAFAIGTIAALAHDVIITVGIYFMLGNQLSLPIVAALLTIVGYSANDTIVVFDRIREDLKLLKGKPYREIANISINQTFSRTLLTSLTTLFTIVMLLLFGGGAIFDFALALFIGVLVGTYSSTFVATPVMLLWHKEDKAA